MPLNKYNLMEVNMSRWQERFDQHPIHETLREARELVQVEFEDVDENEVSERRRLMKSISSYEGALSKVDAELVPLNQIDSLNQALRHQNFFQQLINYSNNGDVSFLVVANDYISNQFTPLSLLLSMAGAMSGDALIKDLEGSVDYISSVLASKKSALSADLQSLASSVEKAQEDLAGLIRLVETRRSETESQLSQWQGQFSESQERRNIRFSEWLQEVSSNADDATDGVAGRAEESLRQYQNGFELEIKDLLKDATDKHKTILDLYELTASDSVGGGYTKTANEERGQANTWRLISIGFIVATVAWLCYAYSQPILLDPWGEVNWPKVLMSFSLTGVLLFGAGYSSQQSNRHRLNEKKTRWFALQVKAFDPFINSLDQSDRNQLKKLISERLFGVTDGDKDVDTHVINEHAMNVVFKGIADIIGKMPKG